MFSNILKKITGITNLATYIKSRFYVCHESSYINCLLFHHVRLKYIIALILYRVADACHPYEPFKCPGDGNCISIQYLCDGAPDCSDGYDEDMRLCTAGKNKTKIL